MLISIKFIKKQAGVSEYTEYEEARALQAQAKRIANEHKYRNSLENLDR